MCKRAGGPAPTPLVSLGMVCPNAIEQREVVLCAVSVGDGVLGCARDASRRVLGSSDVAGGGARKMERLMRLLTSCAAILYMP